MATAASGVVLLYDTSDTEGLTGTWVESIGYLASGRPTGLPSGSPNRQGKQVPQATVISGMSLLYRGMRGGSS